MLIKDKFKLLFYNNYFNNFDTIHMFSLNFLNLIFKQYENYIII